MGVTVSGLNGLRSDMLAKLERIVQAFLDDLDYIGQRAVGYIRNRAAEDSWYDRTGNLRSSIGYVIVQDGNVIRKGGFDRVDGPERDKTNEDGSQVGLSFAEEVATEYPKGYALIVVAGMEYASLVEKMDNKDVLASGEIFVRKEVKKLVDKYDKIGRQ